MQHPGQQQPARVVMQPGQAPPALHPDIPTNHELNVIRETARIESLFQAWVNSGLEQTKSVFTLSAAGVGFAAQILFSMTPRGKEAVAPVWLLLACVVFGLAALACVWVFRINSRLVESKIATGRAAREDGLVGRADIASKLLFGAGLVFTMFAAVSHQWLDKEVPKDGQATSKEQRP